MDIMSLITSHGLILLSLAITGVFAGLLAGLLGVGGGIVIVPVLFFMFQSFGVSADSAMLIATASSLATIIPTSISSIRAHHQKGNVDFQRLKRWSLWILAGVLLGSYVITRVEGRYLVVLFGVIAMLSSLNMLFYTGKTALFKQLPHSLGQHLMSTSIGFFSVMVGIGGGTLSVPLLTLFNYPVHKAVGTAAAIGLIIALPGASVLLLAGDTPTDAPEGTWGLVNFIAVAFIVPLTVLFAPIGARLAARLDAEKLKKIFAVVLLLTGLRMLAQSWF